MKNEEHEKSLEERILVIPPRADLAPINKPIYMTRRELRDHNKFRYGVLAIIASIGIIGAYHKAGSLEKMYDSIKHAGENLHKLHLVY